MTISKLFPVFCALAVGAASFTVRAEDNPAQAAARLALAKQAFDLGATNSPAVPVEAAAPAADSQKAPTGPAAAKAKAKQDAKEAKAKAAADKAAAKADAEQAKAKAKQDAKEAEAKAATEKAAAKAAAKQAKATKETESKPAPAVPAAAAPKLADTATNSYAGKELGLKPVAAPALPIPSSKAGRLEALLAKYKADQITPEEYHQQRAAILAEP